MKNPIEKKRKPGFFSKYGATCCFLLPWLTLFLFFPFSVPS